MTKSNTKTLSRKGFSKINDNGDWKIENGKLIWRDSPNTSISIDQLPGINPEVIISPCPVTRQRRKEIMWSIANRHKLTAAQRHLMMQWALIMPVDLFFKVAAKLLTSRNWSDEEKLFYLWSKLPRLSGFEYGEKVHDLLLTLKWKEKSFKKRMQVFYDAARKYSLNGSDTEWQLAYDEKAVASLSNDVVLYRGFNVPADKTIREKDISRWMKQQYGKSVYYSIDSNIAERFACIQKHQMIKVAHETGAVSPDMKDMIEGKIVIARYRTDIDNLVMYDDVLGRCEGECICLPENVDLLDYRFLGFDDFIRILKTRNPRAIHGGISPTTGEKLI
jgi:hypothetical protein